MSLAMILAVAFIYIVLASQFESFLEPLIIMLSLPLAVVGALLLLLATGNNLGMPAMIGMVMLMGLVTKNAILLVDYQPGAPPGGPAGEGGAAQGRPVRLRPILMTTLAMILGMTAVGARQGDGGEFRSPISIATIGGLITSTLLTLVVVPVAYLLLARGLAWLRKLARAARSPAVPGRPRGRACCW
jgi:hydrophobic/amphiphilic exporter-1 (mainly G- bacteria), HAE1 family